MSYEVLARRLRPRTFADVVGQQHVTQTLRNAVSHGRVPHAILLCGPRGVGKTSIARILAQLSERPDGDALRQLRALPRDRLGQLARRAGDRRGEPHRRGERARDPR